MKNGKVLARLANNPRVATLAVNETDATITVTLNAGFVNNGSNVGTVKNAHAARLFIRDAIGPDGRTARPGRPSKTPARVIELSTAFVDRVTAAGANIGTVTKRNSKKTTIVANGSQIAALTKLANADAASTNIGLKGSAAAVLRAIA